MTAAIVHRQIEANGITFHVAISGPEHAVPILCLHGFPEGWMSWRHLMQLLPESRIYAPDLRGYPGSSCPKNGYDVFTLTDDINALIEVLGIRQCALVSHDWGTELAWIFAHRYASQIREGRPGTMDVALVDEIVARFKKGADTHGPVEYYRQIVLSILLPKRRRQLHGLYATPISVPVIMTWGTKDGALPAVVARKSFEDAGCECDWRPLLGVGHFVDLETSEKLANELKRLQGNPERDEFSRIAE
jgi:epoxide hydrolase 4